MLGGFVMGLAWWLAGILCFISIIGIPFALKESGVVAGILLLVLVSYFTDKTLRMLVELASFSPRLKDYGVLTFEDMLSVRAAS